MKNLILVASILLNIVLISYKVVNSISERQKPPTINTVTYTLNRNELYKYLPINSDDDVFIGDSQFQFFDIAEFFKLNNLKNRGIMGDVTVGLYKRLPDIVKSSPKKVFIEIGVNDIIKNIPSDTSIYYYDHIVSSIRSNCPNTLIYVLSVLPSNAVNNKLIDNFNRRLHRLSKNKNTLFINLTAAFSVNGHLNSKFDCGDGLHLTGPGYLLLTSILRPYL